MTSKTAKSDAPRKINTKPSRATKSEQRPPAERRRTMILFGLDENKRPRAGRFVVDENLGLLAKAAETMALIICEVKSPKLSDLALKLPAGRLHAGGPGFVPYIRPDLYEKLVEAAGADAAAPTEPPAAASAPRTFDEISAGHLVIAQEDLETGWWEAIVFEADGDTLTLRYRDFPRLPKFKRPRNAVALLSAASSN